MESRFQTYKDQGYKQYLLINAPDTFNGTPTASYCASIQSQYGLTFPVLYDPIGSFTSTFGFSGANEQNLVLKQGGEIVLIGRYNSQSSIQQAIESALP